MKKTVVIGASTNPERYAFKATQMLLQYGHEVVLFGLRAGQVAGNDIQTNLEHIDGVDTVTLYVSEKNQSAYIPFILALNPKESSLIQVQKAFIFKNYVKKMALKQPKHVLWSY